MTLSKQEYTAIQKVLRNRSMSIPINKIWKSISNETGIGDISSNVIRFSASDHKKLREICIDTTGADPLLQNIKGTRTEVTALVNNEKWTTKNVFEGFIKISAHAISSHSNNQFKQTPAGTMLYLDFNTIDLSSFTAVVIVENGAAAISWIDFKIPQELKNYIVVYRGHDAESRYVKEFLNKLPDDISKIGFFDFDPAGIGMAIDYKVDAILIPEILDKNILKRNKKDCFEAQINRRPNLEKEIPVRWLKTWKWLTNKENKCAITQENMLANKIKLKLLE